MGVINFCRAYVTILNGIPVIDDELIYQKLVKVQKKMTRIEWDIQSANVHKQANYAIQEPFQRKFMTSQMEVWINLPSAHLQLFMTTLRTVLHSLGLTTQHIPVYLHLREMLGSINTNHESVHE